MKTCSDAERAALKTGTKLLVTRLGGLEAAASVTRVGPTNLSEYGSPHCADRFAPVDVVADLERVAERPAVTEALARLSGFILTPVLLPGEGCVAESLRDVAATSGQTIADALKAIQDGLPEGELRTLDDDLTRLHSVTASAVGVVRAKLAEMAGSRKGLAIVG